MDLPEAIKDWLEDKINDVTIHVGEDVPQYITGDFVWFMRSGETIDDQLTNPPAIISTTFDVEVVSKSIGACRLLTEQVKFFFRNSTDFELSYLDDTSGSEQTKHIASFDVENHDDNYIPHLVELDAKIHIGSFLLTAYHG